MALAEKIAAAKAALVAKKDQLQVVSDRVAAVGDDERPEAADVALIEELSEQIDRHAEDIVTLERAQAALARNAQPAGGANPNGGRAIERETESPRLAGTLNTPALALGGNLQRRKPDISLFVRSAIAAFESHHTHQPIADIIEARWPGSTDLLEVSKLVTGVRKAAQNPAHTQVPEWAGVLVRETFGAFMDLLYPESFVPRLPMGRLEFNGEAPIKIPMRLPIAAGDNTLAGAFRKEGDPIRVGATRLGTKTINPYQLGVIGTFTMEMLESSIMNFEQAVQRWMIEDTAQLLDTVFIDDTAQVDGVRPAGLQSGLAPEDIGASSGVDPANIQQDLRDRITVMTNAMLGRRAVWLMNPQRATGLAMAWNPVGQPAFPSMSAPNPTLAGYPVVTSINVPADLVFLIDCAELNFAGGAPRFNYSEQASLVEQNGLPIVDGVPAAVQTLDAGAPARSLWQTNSGGIRALWRTSWAVMRPHAVQVITGVAW